MLNIQALLRCFPEKLYQKIDSSLKLENEFSIHYLEEIRIRVNRPVILKIKGKEKIIEYTPSQESILEMMQHICDNSIYSYQNQICNRIYYYARRSSSRNCWKCGSQRAASAAY